MHNLQNEFLVKNEKGEFKLWRDGREEALPNLDLSVPQDDLLVLSEEQSGGKPVANFYFDVEDENELQHFKKQKSSVNQARWDRYIEEKAKTVISQAGLGQIKDERSQLVNIIKSYWRGWRSLALTKEALNRLKITAPVADWRKVLLNILQKEKKLIDKMVQAGKVPDIDVEARADKKEPARTEGNKIDWGVHYEKKHEVLDGKDLPKAVVMGPVEELKSLSLDDFRRMADNPKEAAEKIFEKISYLEDESLVKRAEGIQAWKKSPVYKLYLKIGGLSLKEKRPVEQIILDLKNKQQPFLSPAEFQAIADLNNRLSY